MRARAKQTLGAATRAVSPKVTERASPWRKGCSYSDRQALCQSDVIATWLRHCQHPCPLRRSAPALPKGEPLPKRRSLTEYPKPLPLGEVSPKVTERASPWRKGCSHSDGHRLLLKRYNRCVKASTLASLPSQALRASSPKGRAFTGQGETSAHRLTSYFVITYYPSHDEYRHQFIITVWRCGIKSQTVNFIKK